MTIPHEQSRPSTKVDTETQTEPSPLAPLLAKSKHQERPASPGRRGFLSRALSALPFVALAGSAVVGARPAEMPPELQSLVGRTFVFRDDKDKRVYRVTKIVTGRSVPLYVFPWMSDWIVYEYVNDKELQLAGAGRVGTILTAMNFSYKTVQAAR